MHILRRVAIAAVAVLVLAGCGDDTAAPSQGQSSTLPATASDAQGGGEFDCSDGLRTLLVFNQDYSYSVRRGTAPASVDYDGLADDLEAFAASAPDAIAAPMDDYVDQVAPYWRELAAIGFDPSDPGSVDPDAYAAATSDLDGPAVDQSATELQEWLGGSCEDE